MALNSRLISAADLATGGFVGLADQWGEDNGLTADVVTISAATYTLPDNPNLVFVFTGTVPQTITIPADLENWKAGNVMKFILKSTGGITIVGDEGVTIEGAVTVSTSTLYGIIYLHKMGTNEYIAKGDID